MGELELACIGSWKANLPDYKFRLWTEHSLDLKQYTFAWKAYQSGKYAFVSDVVRLHALYMEGGIYLDTDMLVLKNLDIFLSHDFFTAEYRPAHLNAAVVGSLKGHPILVELLALYNALEFDFFKPKTIPVIFDEIVGSSLNPSVKIYSPEYFYPLPFEKKEEDYSLYLSGNSYAVHLWNHSWKDEFALLREDRFLQSVYLAARHYFRFPKIYRNKAYFIRYASQFKKHIRRFLKKKWDQKTLSEH